MAKFSNAWIVSPLHLSAFWWGESTLRGIGLWMCYLLWDMDQVCSCPVLFQRIRVLHWKFIENSDPTAPPEPFTRITKGPHWKYILSSLDWPELNSHQPCISDSIIWPLEYYWHTMNRMLRLSMWYILRLTKFSTSYCPWSQNLKLIIHICRPGQVDNCSID